LLILNLLNKFALGPESLGLNFGDNGEWFLFKFVDGDALQAGHA
jgi:hypothetical protein